MLLPCPPKTENISESFRIKARQHVSTRPLGWTAGPSRGQLGPGRSGRWRGPARCESSRSWGLPFKEHKASQVERIRSFNYQTVFSRLAKSDDCLAAKKLLTNRTGGELRKLVIIFDNFPALTRGDLITFQVESKNMSGSTPLHVAAYHGSREMINLLLESGPSPGQMNKNKVGDWGL